MECLILKVRMVPTLHFLLFLAESIRKGKVGNKVLCSSLFFSVPLPLKERNVRVWLKAYTREMKEKKNGKLTSWAI